MTTTGDLADLSYRFIITVEQIGLPLSFKVTAINEAGEGDYSGVLDIVAGTVPSQPLNVAKVNSTVDQITISWQAPIDNGGSPITDYQIYWDNGLGSSMSLVASTVGGPVLVWTTVGTISATAIQNGVYYRFSVVSVNAIGVSSNSAILGVYAAEAP